jgi:drug/metabolite transporter (DMT)-like permease
MTDRAVPAEATAPAPAPEPARLRGSILPPAAVLLLILCTATWGLNPVSVKLAIGEIGPMHQTLIRAVIASGVLTAVMLARGRPLPGRDGTLAAGLVVGFLFAVEFLMIFGAVAFTTAARTVVFTYTMPFFVAAMALVFLPGERLGRLQLIGLAGAFGGVLIAFADGLAGGAPASALIGDGLAILGAATWAATTIVIKRTGLARTDAMSVLWYQLVVSIPVSAAAVVLLGEPAPAHLSLFGLGVIAFQSVWVAVITYLVWFGMIGRYPAPVLSGFTFLTPMFGVLFGHLVLGEPVGWTLVVALALVATGIVLVNRRR